MFTIQFKASSPVVLGDDLAQLSAVRRTVEITAWGGAGAVQETNGFFTAVPILRPLANTRGEFSFSATATLTDVAGAAQELGDRIALIGVQDTLTIKSAAPGGSTKIYTYSNAICQSAMRSPSPKSNGVRVCVDFVFRVGALVIS